MHRPQTNGRVQTPSAIDRIPPHSEEAEAGALGCILLAESQKEKETLAAQLRPEQFYLLTHRTLFEEMSKMFLQGHFVDMLTFQQWLKDAKLLASVGGAAYVAGLPDGVPSVANFSYYADIVREKAFLRWALQQAQKTIDAVWTAERVEDVQAVVRETYDLQARKADAPRPLIEVVTIEEAKAFQPDPSLFLVGADMLSRGELAAISGWPGLGKSRLGTTLAVAGARGKGEWMDYKVQRRFRTLVLQCENSMRRIKSEVESLPAGFNDWIRISKPCPLSFNRPDFRAELRRFADDWPFDCLILDHWAEIAREEGQADYLQALDDIRSSLPLGDAAPAVVVIAHLRKQRGGDHWRPKQGRELLNELSGSFALGAKARTVFVLQPGSMDAADDRVVFDCAKSNNDTPLPASAWHRRNGEFEPCPDFDFDEWLNPPEEAPRRAVTAADLAAIFDNGKTKLTRQRAAALLQEAGFSQATAYRATDPVGRFEGHLFVETAGGLIAWKA